MFCQSVEHPVEIPPMHPATILLHPVRHTVERPWDPKMMQSFLEDSYAKFPAEFNGSDGPAYADASVDVDWRLVNP